MSPTGVGKYLFICHFAAANLMHGKNVLYITLEMSEEEISKRIDANLLDISQDKLADMDKSLFIKRVEKVKAKTTGNLVVNGYPTSTAGASHFRFLLKELALKTNFVPDIVYVGLC